MAKYTYPLLNRVSEIFADADLGDIFLLASQHLLEPQLEMFRHLIELGLKSENCLVIGKTYSTNQGVMEDLSKMGCVVAPFSLKFDPLHPFDKWFEEKLREFLRSQLANRNLADYRKIIILDDGGFLHLVAKDMLCGHTNIVGIEQTSSGHHKIQAGGISFPYVSVARSFHKLVFESPLIGRCGYERIFRHITNRRKRNPKILIKGFGPIGQQIAVQLFVAKNYDGYASDLSFDTQRTGHGITQLLRNKRRLLSVEEANKRLGEYDVVIGTTGSSTFTKADIERFHPEVSLVSMSSSDREFPSVPFRQNGGGPHDDYYLDGRCLVNAGFPITFYGWPNEMPPQQIELTIAQLMMNVLGEAADRQHQMNYVVEQIRSIWDPHKDADQWYAEKFS